MHFISRLRTPVGITLLFLCLALLASDYHFRWKNEKWKFAINSDGYHYYHYLPMVFIDHDFVTKDKETGAPKPIKHYIGTALFNLPFFAAAYLASVVFHFPADGMSLPFQVMISIATLFYLLAGLYFLNRFLKFYVRSSWIIVTILLACVLATNVFYFTVIAPGWAHIVAFAMISFLLFQVKRIFTHYSNQSLFLIIVTLSFLFWTRPTDILIVIIFPFLAGNWEVLKNTLRNVFNNRFTIIAGCAVALVPMICQLIMYWLQTGHFIVWSYAGEGRFNFLKPEISNLLFSYAKGLFVYTPVCLFSLAGLIFLFRENRRLFLGLTLCLAVNIYVMASWWCWNYGWCFGSRPFIDFFPLFFLPLAILFRETKKLFLHISYVILLVFFSVLNLFQTYQAEHGILDLDFRTDRKGYWNVFFRNDRGYSGKFYRIPVDSSASNLVHTTVYFNDMEKPDSSWINLYTLAEGTAHSGNTASRVNKDAWYSCGRIMPMSEVPYNRNVLIRASGWFFIPGKGSGSYFAISFSHDGKSFNFNPYGLDGFSTDFGKWQYLVFEMVMPRIRNGKPLNENKIEFYLFNNSDMNCYVDDMKIEFIEFKKLERVLDIWWDY